MPEEKPPPAMMMTTVKPPPQREVARAVQNLGNTCYMNAVLQALAHAPELCMAMDVQSHRLTCPIYKENVEKITSRSSTAPGSAASSRSSSPDHFLHHSGAQDIYSADPSRTGNAGTRKSRRTRSPTNSSIMGASASASPTDPAAAAAVSRKDDPNATKFCALCEVEQHMNNVHRGQNSSGPVAPTNFVHGFIDHVAPWFKLGQQEDSHEFLRLLIDAMQKSCKQARPKTIKTEAATAAAVKTEPLVVHQGNPQDTPPEDVPMEDADENDDSSPNDPYCKECHDSEYPFQLFRGMVESKVTCGQCQAVSSTVDPIEDLGVEVTPMHSSSTGLASVGDALKRFTRVEELDAGYKCEKCGKVGRATKESKLASLPPILTIHLKRFRYGASAETASTAIPAAGNGNGTRRSQRSSELSQLMSTNLVDWTTGKSGSAKIEGHSEFKSILDLKELMTPELLERNKAPFVRLFAVIVHVGKNSHSGHYLAYVRNIEKNEWWKMDDARVTLVDEKEVLNAEAYMLFYRATAHPYIQELKNQVEVLKKTYEEQKAALAVKREAPDSPRKSKEKISNKNKKSDKSTDSADTGPAARVKNNPRKRKAPEFSCGEEWARKKASVPDYIVSGLKQIEAKVSDYVNFTPRFMRLMNEQAQRPNSRVGHGPASGICLDEDIKGGVLDNVQQALLRCFMRLSEENGGTLARPDPEPRTTRSAASREKSQPQMPVVIPEEAEDVL